MYMMFLDRFDVKRHTCIHQNTEYAPHVDKSHELGNIGLAPTRHGHVINKVSSENETKLFVVEESSGQVLELDQFCKQTGQNLDPISSHVILSHKKFNENLGQKNGKNETKSQH